MNAAQRRPVRGRPAVVRSLMLFALFATVLAASDARAKLETWREDSASSFAKAKREGVVVTDTGMVRLGRMLLPRPKLDAVRVWDLAATAAGVVYAATGDEGKVYRREAKEDAPWTTAYDAGDTQALSLTVTHDGRVFAGTGPGGQVVEITDPKHPSSRPGPEVKYVWDLAADAKGNLYAATGPNGQLWKRSADGKWVLLLDSKHAHLRCLALMSDGSICAGSDGDGLVYRVSPEGKASIVFDAVQHEVTALVPGPEGSLFVGTANESGGSSGRSSALVSDSEFSAGPKGGGDRTETAADPDAPSPPEAKRPGNSRTSSGGSAAPRTSSGGSNSSRSSSGRSGENAVYRVDHEGVAREVFRSRDLIFALARQGDHLMIGTGPDGQLYEVRDEGRESAPVARLDSGQILALATERDGGLLVGTGDPGTVYRLTTGHVQEGELISEVHDAKLISRFGALAWRATAPQGTSVSLQTRSGNVGEPDETWSAWSAPQTDPENSRAVAPPARFVQYRAIFKTNDAAHTPELHAVWLRYQTANLPPEVTKIDVPDVSAGDGTIRQTRLTLRWDATDPNDDELKYTLHLRKEGWPEWIPLGEEALDEKTFSWDTTTVPDGLYRLRVTASDRLSNGAEDAQARDRESEPFLVDHEAPVVTIERNGGKVTVKLKDNLTRLAKAAYAIDGGEWVPVFPDDALYDTSAETITLALPDLKPGAHVLVIRATDAAGNTGTGDALLPGR